jgi:phospholipase/lecithinase/hemolysin
VHGDFPPSEYLGFENMASLHLIGPVVGNNFAVFQSLASGNGPEDLPAQIDAYLNSNGGKADKNALHFLFIGGTDVINAAFLTPDDAQSLQLLDAAVAGLETAIRRLAAAGAKTVFAPNFTDLGTTPAARKYGIVKRANWISRVYNHRFEKMLDRVECDLPKLEIIRWDFYKFSHELLDRADELGYTNITDSCVDHIPAGTCNFDKFVFVDDFFVTTKTHRFFASAAMQALITRDDHKGPHGHKGERKGDHDRKHCKGPGRW